MIKHLIKLVWNRKRANFLIMIEIFFSFLVLFAVVGWRSFMLTTIGARSVSSMRTPGTSRLIWDRHSALLLRLSKLRRCGNSPGLEESLMRSKRRRARRLIHSRMAESSVFWGLRLMDADSRTAERRD